MELYEDVPLLSTLLDTVAHTCGIEAVTTGHPLPHVGWLSRDSWRVVVSIDDEPLDPTGLVETYIDCVRRGDTHTLTGSVETWCAQVSAICKKASKAC